MCHLKKKKENAFKKQTVLPRAFLAQTALLLLPATVIGKHRLPWGRTEASQTFLLQAQVTAAVLCHRPDSLGAMSRLGNAMFAGHLPTKVGALLCQGMVIFVTSFSIGNYWALLGIFFIARSNCSVRILTLLY